MPTSNQYMTDAPAGQQDDTDLQHRMWLIQHDALYTAPIATVPPGMRVVDIGCGNGTWAISFAKQHPQARVIGLDLAMPQPDSVPSNCSFVVGNAEGNWTFASASDPFDFIHGRMLINSIRGWPIFLRMCLKHLKPGGWCEFSDLTHRFFAADGCSESESAMLRWWRCVFQESSKYNGVDIDDSYKHAEQLRRAGFRDVRERIFQWHVGAANGHNDKAKTLGYLLKQNLQVLIGSVTFVAIKNGHIKGMSVDAVKQLAEDAKRDVIENAERHGYYMHSVTYIGQAPM